MFPHPVIIVRGRQLSSGQDVKAGAAAGDTKDSWDAGLGDTWSEQSE